MGVTVDCPSVLRSNLHQNLVPILVIPEIRGSIPDIINFVNELFVVYYPEYRHN